ncbi:hypothetical protein GIB67_010729 [Kingdonia uniflora]|uniref:Uncharacterized protein n=1 Tax=Kingdonia uniflora TaxID=39325 RepID=A0A7J7L8S7_9MAGN|nr:hypothetical protein GIB67_010729 [Kingdonia uniflora]
MKRNMASRQVFQVSPEIFYNDVEARKYTLCYPIVEIHAFDSLLRKLHKYVPYGSSVADLYAGASFIRLSLAIARKCRQEPLSWLKGSDVVVVDPPRKGLDYTLVEALQTLASSERKVKASKSPFTKGKDKKDEKRPWILRARESSVQIESKTPWEKNQSFPRTFIYISCGWESFKEREHESIQRSSENVDSTITWTEYKSMTYTSMVINEIVRLANIVHGVFRRTIKEVEKTVCSSKARYTIPAGWAVMVCPPAVHLNSAKYEDPLVFNPLRWEVDDSEGRRYSQKAWFDFSLWYAYPTH